jgi:transcriptional regulator with XRE-family HTH domain
MDQDDNLLGSFLKERRARLDPASFGLPLARRRTPGLRREEVAQLAHVSATWYTWLEQGRGGAPSADVLDRLARALSLTEEEREHLFLLAQERPPVPRYTDRSQVTPYLQRVLDAFPATPAIIKTPEWTVLAWNRAASTVLADYASIPEPERNILRLLFREGGHDHLPDWEEVARNIVGTVRRDIVRAGMREETRALIEDLSESSADFRRIWADQDVGGRGEHSKRIRHPQAGLISFEYSTFSVDGHPDLALVVFNPATEEDRSAIDKLIGRT